MIEIKVSEILTELPTNTNGLVSSRVERSPDQPALVEACGSWKHSQLKTVFGGRKTWLPGLGMRLGDRVLLVCENCRALVATLLALTSMDACPAVVDARLAANEIDAIRKHCGARRVVDMTEVSPQATEHADRDGALIAPAGSHVCEVMGLPANIREIFQQWKPYQRRFLGCCFHFKAANPEFHTKLLNEASWYAGPYDGDTKLMP
jgi:acyl-CoA synthetase (AMP-forming)/AMP-acid ligase II